MSTLAVLVRAAASRAIVVDRRASVSTGKCEPCCSMAPIGMATTAPASRASAISFRVRFCQRISETVIVYLSSERSEIEYKLVASGAGATNHHDLVGFPFTLREYRVAVIGQSFQDIGLACAAYALHAGSIDLKSLGQEDFEDRLVRRNKERPARFGEANFEAALRRGQCRGKSFKVNHRGIELRSCRLECLQHSRRTAAIEVRAWRLLLDDQRKVEHRIARLVIEREAYPVGISFA